MRELGIVAGELTKGLPGGYGRAYLSLAEQGGALDWVWAGFLSIK
jgi:hypothetical protein